MKKTLLAALFLLFGLSIHAQYLADSLASLATKETHPQKKAELLLQAADKSFYYDTLKSKKYLSDAINISDKKNNYLLSYAKYIKGKLHRDIDFDDAIKYLKEASELIANNKDSKSRELYGNIWYFIGTIEQRKDNSHEFLKVLYEKCIPIAKETGNNLNLSNYYIAVGIILLNEINLDNALKNFNNANEILEREKNTQEVVEMQVKSNLYITEAYLRKREFGNAEKFLTISHNYLTQLPDSHLWTEYYNISSIFYQQTGNYEKALMEANHGLAIAGKTNNFYDVVRLTYMKGLILKRLGRYNEAIEILKELLHEKNATLVKMNIGNVYHELAGAEAERGNFEAAYKYALERIAVTDSMYDENNHEFIAEMETKFRTAENEKRIAQNELEINKKNQYMWMLGTAAFLFLILGLFAYVYFKNKRKLAIEREINLQQKLKQKEQEEELKLTQAVLDGEESERQRIAKDLHDGLGGMLTGVKLKLSSWSLQNLNDRQSESFNPIIEQLNNTTTELRRVSRNLMPESLLRNGLEMALGDLCEFYSNEKTVISYVPLNLKDTLPLNQQINIYRIIQELLSNVVKHAEASVVLVQCTQNDNQFLITVEDNGKGMDINNALKEKSLGLKSMRNRVEFLKGQLEITSAPGEGTTVEIELPV